MTKEEFEVWLEEFNQQQPFPVANCHWCGEAIGEGAVFRYGGVPPPRLYHPDCHEAMEEEDGKADESPLSL
jgi:hypothetical protein